MIISRRKSAFKLRYIVQETPPFFTALYSVSSTLSPTYCHLLHGAYIPPTLLSYLCNAAARIHGAEVFLLFIFNLLYYECSLSIGASGKSEGQTGP